MRRAICGVALGVMVVLSQGADRAQAQDTRIDVPLKYRAFASPSEALGLTRGGLIVWTEAGRRAADEYTLPKVAGRPVLFTILLPGRQRRVTGVLGRSAAAARHVDRLWLDWNQDRKFSADERLAGTPAGEFITFGPTQPPGREGKKSTAICVAVDAGSLVYVFPAGYQEGEVTLAGKSHRIAAVDGNANSVYEDAGDEVHDGDLLLVDADQDGAFDAWSASPGDMWDSEVVPLARRLQMPDGLFYRVAVAADASSLSLERDPSPVGRVRAGCARLALGLANGDDRLWIRSATGEATVPAGRYRIEWVMLAEKDEEGKLWVADIGFYGESSEQIQVNPDAVTELNCGAPFRLALEVGRYGRGVFLSLSLRDRGNHSVSDILTPSGDRPAEPVLNIAATDGRPVKRQKFHYG